MSPFTAWIMLNGMATLDLRCRAMADAALQVARALDGHKALARVIYPGLASHAQFDLVQRQMGSGGTLVAFDIAGGKQAAFRFMNALEIIKISNNLLFYRITKRKIRIYKSIFIKHLTNSFFH